MQSGDEPTALTGAKSRKLALWVGGDQAVFDKHRAVLDSIGDQVRYVGPIGAGLVAKLVHNCAGYAIQTALAEVFTMGVKAGVPALDLWAAVRQGSLGRIRTFDRLGKQFLQGAFDPPEFALKLAHKDMSLATQLGRELGVPMRLAKPFAGARQTGFHFPLIDGTEVAIAFRDGEKVVATPAAPTVKDLDAIEPDWSVLEWSKYTYVPLGKRVAIASADSTEA